MKTTVYNDIDDIILKFMRTQVFEGHFENTAREIANGSGLSYNRVVKALERLRTRDQIRYRSRGTEARPVPYYYLREILDLCHKKWKK